MSLARACPASIAAIAFALSVSFLADAVAQGATRLERGRTYLIQLEPGQADAPQAESVVEALRSGLDRHGLVYDLSDRAELIATYNIEVDQGRWIGKGAARRFVYTGTLTIGLSPAGHPAVPLSRRPAFGVRVSASSPEPAHVADVGCMARLGVAALAAGYRLSGRVDLDGSSCARN
jgi:hypothetical protein